MNGLTNEWMNEWANKRMYKWVKKMNKTTNKWIDYWIKEGINKITNEWTDGRLKEWMNESMNELTNEETECWRWLSHVGGDAWCWWRPTLIYKTGEKHEKKNKGKNHFCDRDDLLLKECLESREKDSKLRAKSLVKNWSLKLKFKEFEFKKLEFKKLGSK